MVGAKIEDRLIQIRVGRVALEGNLSPPEQTGGVVLFAHGSGSSRHSPRNRHVARMLNRANLATLSVDLLTPEEEALDVRTACASTSACSHWAPHRRNRLANAASRYSTPSRWLLRGQCRCSAGSGSRAVRVVGAVVSRGGRPDLAGPALARVRAPTLLIVGGYDLQVIQLNRVAFAQLHCEKELVIVPGATHLFEEPGTLDEVARLAREWFERYLMAAQLIGNMSLPS
jgi:putative phosphoribosyl transferase